MKKTNDYAKTTLEVNQITGGVIMNHSYRVFSLAIVLLLLLSGCATPETRTTVLPSASLIKQHLLRLKDAGFDQILIDLGNKYNLPPTFLFAIASRETNCRNIIGDEGNGIGLMQIDIRYHEIAKQQKVSGQWESNPEILMDYGASLLAKNLHMAKTKLDKYPSYIQLYAAASNYNCGRAITLSSKNGLDSDQCTTGKNYAHDVMLRKSAFDELIQLQPE